MNRRTALAPPGRPRPLALPVVMVLTLLGAAAGGCGSRGAAPDDALSADTPAGGATIRVALFNIRELTTDKLTDVDAGGAGRDPQARAAAEIVRRVRPDVLVVQEIDHDLRTAEAAGDLARNARRFAAAYLERGDDPLRLPHAWAAPCNTGILSGLDLDDDGRVATPADAGSPAHGGDSFGWGIYPGQYAMAVLSRFPLAEDRARTFQRFLWRDLRDHHLPPGTYDDAELARLRLSSKSHWDLPVVVGDRRLHLFVSHPTPPVFDGEEDRNGRRNFDEIKLWVDYLADRPELVDDAGRRGGFASAEPFVVVGDLNADPVVGESLVDGRRAADQLLDHPLLTDTGAVLVSRGALGGRRPGPPDHPERATAVFGDGMRLDYLLPARGVEVLGGGVFWPSAEEEPEGHRLAEEASDHRLVWLDLRLPG